MMVRSVLAGALGLLCLGCHQTSSAQRDPTAPPGEVWLSPHQVADARIEVVGAAERVMGQIILTSGRVTFNDLQVAHVFSPVAGRIVRIDAHLGEFLKRGDALATLDSPDLDMAAADVDKAHADFVAAEHERKRQYELAQAHAGVQRDRETAEDNFLKAQAELARASKKARLLRSPRGGNGQNYVLRSPIEGELLAHSVSPGMEVAGLYSGGSPVELFTVGALDPVWLVADVFEMDVGRVHGGEHVEIGVVAYPDKLFPGTVDWVSPALDSSTRTARARCTIKNPDRLLMPEMYATVRIEAPGRSVLALPRSAVLRMADQNIVLVEVGDDAGSVRRFERRSVVIDEEQQVDGWIPVTRGVTAGDRVVTSGALLVSALL